MRKCATILNQTRKAFTLVELLTVIAIIAILAVVVSVAYSVAKQKSAETQKISELTEVASALSLYYSDKLSYPLSTDFDAVIDALRPNAPGVNNYLSKDIPNNGYYYSGSGTTYRLWFNSPRYTRVICKAPCGTPNVNKYLIKNGQPVTSW